MNIMKEKMPQTMAVIALIAALGASVMLLFLPIYSGTTTPPVNVNTGVATGQPVAMSATLLEVNGPRVFIPLVIPVVLAGLGLLAVLRAKRWRLLFVWIAAFLLAVFVLITGFSIGMFYVPAMILSMTAAIVTQFRGDTIAKSQ
jgi:hypothetical protein